MHQYEKWIVKTGLMKQSLSCSAVLIQSLEKRKTAYLNIFDILKKLFMLEIIKVKFHKNLMPWLLSGTDRVPLPCRFLYLYNYTNQFG